MKRVSILLGLLILLTLAAQAALDGLFYHPDRRSYTTPSAHDQPYEKIEFNSPDGTRLCGWFIPAKSKPLGTVIHFHGNAQNMSAHYSFVSWLPENGFNLFMFDYRGYGQSEGRPSRRGVYEDSKAALDYLLAREDIDPRRVIVFGQSIGGANALAVVGRNRYEQLAGIAVDSAFSAYKRVACDHAGWLKPLAWCLVGNSLSPERTVDRIAPTPLLIMHGTDDPVVPYHHARHLYEKAASPKTLWTVEGGGHTAALGPFSRTYAPKLHARFVEWIATAAKRSAE